MNLNKTEHFLDFIFCNGLLEDVACGTTTNFFYGESQILPNDDNSHYLRDINHILKTMKPSQRRSVEGLDDTIGGLNGFIIEGNCWPIYGKENSYLGEV